MIDQRIGAVGTAIALLSTLAGVAPGVATRVRAVERVAGSGVIGPFALSVAVDGTAGHALVASADLDNRNGGPTGPGRIALLDSRTGRLLRTVAAGLGSSAVAIDAASGHAFVANQGRIEWYTAPDGTNAYRAISPSVGLLDTRTGAVLRSITLGGQVPYALAVDGRAGHTFVATGPMPPTTPGVGGRLVMLDTRTGAIMRTAALDAMPPLSSAGIAVDETTGRVFIATANADSPTGASRLHIVDTTTGAAVRTVALGRGGASLVADATAHRLFVLTSGETGDTTVSVFDTHTGHLLRAITGGKGYGGLAVDARAGHVFVWSGGTYANGQFGGNGAVRMLDAGSGRLLRTAPVGLATAMAVDAAAHRAFVLNRATLDGHGTPRPGGTVSVLDTRGGMVLRTVRVGGVPSAVAFDETAGTAFVTDMPADSVHMLVARSGERVRTVSLGAGPPAPVRQAARASRGAAPPLDRVRRATVVVRDAAWSLRFAPHQGSATHHVLVLGRPGASAVRLTAHEAVLTLAAPVASGESRAIAGWTRQAGRGPTGWATAIWCCWTSAARAMRSRCWTTLR